MICLVAFNTFKLTDHLCLVGQVVLPAEGEVAGCVTSDFLIGKPNVLVDV